MRSIYLDYSSSTPVAASVRDSMLPFLSEFYGHPARCHWYGRAAQEAVEDARSHLASLLSCHPSEIVFTSSGTESVNLGILGVCRSISKGGNGEPAHLIISTLEHACVTRCAEQLQREGWQISFVRCNADGVVQVEEFAAAIRPNTRMISLIHASHRIGTVQPIEQIAELCQARDILLHTDAAQSIGKIDCNVDDLGIDLLSLSGHKFYAPKGIGALYVRLGVPIEPILFGESYETGLRPGTANVPGIVGLGQAAKLALAGLEKGMDRTSEMRDRFHHQLESLIGKPLPIHGEHVRRVPGILSIELPGVTAEAMQRRLPEICFGPTHRSSSKKPSAAPCAPAECQQLAYGPTELQSPYLLRISFGWTTSEEELQQAAQLIASAFEALVD